MILDDLRHAGLYRSAHPLFAAAFEALEKGELARRAPGRYELQGDRLFAMVQQYNTKPHEQGRWEAHRKYIDIQFVVSGQEVMGYAPLAKLSVTTPYDAAKDIEFLNGQGSLLTVGAGQFAIFYPQDGHMPTLAADQPSAVSKIVLKVAC